MALDESMFETEAEKANHRRQTIVFDTMDELLKLIRVEDIDPISKIEAAKVIDGISDSMLKHSILGKITEQTEDQNRKLMNKLDDMTKR